MPKVSHETQKREEEYSDKRNSEKKCHLRMWLSKSKDWRQSKNGTFLYHSLVLHASVVVVVIIVVVVVFITDRYVWIVGIFRAIAGIFVTLKLVCSRRRRRHYYRIADFKTDNHQWCRCCRQCIQSRCCRRGCNHYLLCSVVIYASIHMWAQPFKNYPRK